MFNHGHISAFAALLLGACTLDLHNLGTPATASEATASASGSDESTSSTDPSDGATAAPESSGEQPTGEPPTSETSTSEVSTSESTGTTGTEGGLPDACMMGDSMVDSSFKLDLSGWTDPPTLFLEADVLCTVDTVTSDEDDVTTGLTCDVEGTPRSATMIIATAPEGDVVWQAGDSVHLVVVDVHDPLTGFIHSVQLRRANDEALLLSANDTSSDELITQRFQPLAVGLALTCGKGLDDGAAPVRVDFTLDGGPPLGIISAQRHLLPISAQEGFAIDVGAAIAANLQIEGYTDILLRRVHTDG